MRLHELHALQRGIDEALEESEGEITPEIQQMLDSLEEEIGHKVDWVATVVNEKKAVADGLDVEIKRLQARKKATERSAEGLKDYLKQTLDALGENNVRGRIYSATVQRASRPSISWIKDYDKLPEQFKRVKVELDGTAAYDAYRAGTLPRDGFEVTTSTFLCIR